MEFRRDAALFAPRPPSRPSRDTLLPALRRQRASLLRHSAFCIFPRPSGPGSDAINYQLSALSTCPLILSNMPPFRPAVKPSLRKSRRKS
jgi:hypothetical protein